MVLVHGLGLSGRYMLPTAGRLAPHFPVYLPDLPGFGDSAKPGTLDVPELADALAAWLQTVGLTRTALLGNSFGCQIIADLAARHPELVERAVLQGPTTPPDERSWLWQFVRWRQNQRFNPDSLGPVTWDDYRKCGYRRLFRTFRHQLADAIERKLPRIVAPTLVARGQHDPICPLRFAAEIARRLPRGRLVRMIGIALTDLEAAGPRRLLGTFQHYLRHPIAERLRRVEAPALVVRGTRDALVPRPWAKRTADLLPHGRLVEVRGAAHVMNFHAPERLARLVRRYLELAPAAGTPAGSAG